MCDPGSRIHLSQLHAPIASTCRVERWRGVPELAGFEHLDGSMDSGRDGAFLQPLFLPRCSSETRLEIIHRPSQTPIFAAAFSKEGFRVPAPLTLAVECGSPRSERNQEGLARRAGRGG